MPAMVVSSPFCIAGITFFTAIPATPRTPQRTLPVELAIAEAFYRKWKAMI
jgi:hypothetical protein